MPMKGHIVEIRRKLEVVMLAVRFVLTLSLLLFVVSCQSLSPQRLAETMQSWVGSPFTALTASWGWPTQTFPSGLCEGCIVAVYAKPSATMAVMQASAMAGAYAGGGAAYGSGFAQGMNDAARRNPAICYQSYFVNGSGVITGWRFDGPCP